MKIAELFVQTLTKQGHIITFVESCTGGALANTVTNVPGASAVLMDSFVTYSNDAKIALGVHPNIIETHSVYSRECALAMAEAGLNKSVGATIAVGVTGSLNRTDPANPKASIPGEIFLAIIWKTLEGYKSATFKFELELLLCRSKGKRVIVAFVLRWVLNRIKRTTAA